jgi:hypothetical protein
MSQVYVPHPCHVSYSLVFVIKEFDHMVSTLTSTQNGPILKTWLDAVGFVVYKAVKNGLL